MVVSLFLFFCDHHFHCFDKLHSKLSFVTLPVQRVIDLPLQLIHKLQVNFTSKATILRENKRLTSELLLANVRLQRLDFLEHENAKLQTLLRSSRKIKSKVLFAKIIMAETDNFGRKFTINKGRHQGVYIGQPVVDAYGLLGQVIAVKDAVSKILSITSSNSAIPVMIVRNGLQTVALGTGNDQYLELANVPETADVRVGDILVTSNLGQRFPTGYHVGVVKEIKYVVGERFMKIFVVPKAHIDKGTHVLLVWSNLVKQSKD